MSALLDEKILSALLSEPSIAAAARAAGCGRDAVYSRLHDPQFIERLNAELAARREADRAMSQQAVSAAVATLRDVLTTPTGYNPRDRVRAADVALRHLYRRDDGHV